MQTVSPAVMFGLANSQKNPIEKVEIPHLYRTILTKVYTSTKNDFHFSESPFITGF